MAANYWDSTQRRYWEFSKEQLAALRQRRQDEERSLVQMYPLPEWRHLNLFFCQQINRLGKRLNTRQQAIATAQVYIKRFYCKVEIRRTNPYLVMATALYLACKTEECPQHIRQVVQEAKLLWLDHAQCLEIARLGECEFYMISEMSSQLIVHAPYRTLSTLQAELTLASDELAQAWAVVNDHYMTDLPLLYAPHVIAITALIWVLVLQPTASSVPGVASAAPGAGATGGAAGAAGSTAGTVGTPGVAGTVGSSLNSGGAGGASGTAVATPGMGAGSSSLPPPPLILSLSSLGPGSSTPGGTPGGTVGPGTPILGSAGTPAGSFSGGAAIALMHAAQARAASAAGATLGGIAQGGGATGQGIGAGAAGGGGGGGGNTPTEEAAPADGGRGAAMQWLIRWLAESGLDMEATIDCTQEMISFYMSSEEYSEKQTREQINRFVKARGLDR